MKTQRHALILRLIQRHRVHSQEQLRDLLTAEGTEVTQATLSRDLRDLRLAKVADPSGRAHYAAPSGHVGPFPPVDQLAPTLVLSMEGVGPLLVVRTPPGSAEALGGSLDYGAWDEVLGTIAGDDTLLVIARSEEDRVNVARRLGEMAGL
ncbi:MAG: arginine repressor [Gemmatimonadetes bacterium]|nr:arginine repressor [Gemmatimonadota bacterium]